MARRSKDIEEEGEEEVEDVEMNDDADDESEGHHGSSEEEEEDENSSDEEDSDSEEEPKVELMVTKRERRVNAGNKMASLLASTIQEDDFYSSAYGGGFKEDDQDDVYVSPAHSDGDEVDSDFDRPEEEDEPVSDQDEKNGPRRSKRKTLYKEPTRSSNAELLEKNKKWAVARMGGNVVAANVCDAKTQAERLKEAEKTEKVNVESLKKYEQFELERKKKREKNVVRKVPAPFISIKSKPDGKVVILPNLKRFDAPTKEPSLLCAVTGKKARYRDSLTGLPYASPFAFKVIRDKYTKFLKSQKGNPGVDAYLSQFY